MVSVGMPVFNDKLFLTNSIKSILNQSYRDIELIISDDCSTDGSMDICKYYAKRDVRIKYIRQQYSLGISKNMEFLLSIAKGQYFMWAADDDLWHPDFIYNLWVALVNSPNGIVAFCPYSFVDENNCKIDNMPVRSINFSSKLTFIRLLKLLVKWDDGFGYGIFVREKIRNVKFPIWWSVNRECAINNIYPSLFYYLSRGEFVFVSGEPLWYNRIKPTDKVNHNIIFENNYIKGFLAFALRKFNLYFKCNESILHNKVTNMYLLIILFPFFSIKYLLDLTNEFISSTKLLIKGEKRFF